MDQKTFVAVGGCTPILACTLVPSLIFGALCGQWGTNFIWGLVFGFGWWAAQSMAGPEHWRAAAAIGLLIWVPLVVVGLFFLSRAVWKSENRHARTAFMLLLVISFLPIVPATTVMAIYSNARVPPDINLLIASW